MATRKPKIGDPVIHHGRMHEITAFPEEAYVEGGKAKLRKGIRFENDGFAVETYDVQDLRWSEVDGAWCLFGRLLSRDERVVYEASIGAWPRPENHAIARDVLDRVDLTGLDRTRLTDVVMRQKGRQLVEAGVVAVAEDGTTKVHQKELGQYVDAVIAHVAELRAERGGN